MKFKRLATPDSRQGYALIITMCFLATLLLVFASVMNWSASNSVLTSRNNLYNQTQMAAEAATENALASMISDFDHYNAIGDSSLYTSLVPSTNGWPVGFQFFDNNGNANKVSITTTVAPWGTIPSQFNQLSGLGKNYIVSAQASPVGQPYAMTNTVTQVLWAGQIPLYQFAVFYNMNLEMIPGQAMTINGRVHSNQDIYAAGASSSSPLTFSTNVDASGHVYFTTVSPQVARSGNDIFQDTNSPTAQVGTINLPVGTMTNNNPTNVLAILNPPPSQYNPSINPTAAYSTNGTVYYQNAVDLIISNSASGVGGTLGTNISVYYQNPNAAQQIQLIPPDVTNSPATGSVYLSYSFVTNGSFYDYREGATAQSVDIDVGKLDTWLNNAGTPYNNQNTTGSAAKPLAHGINSIYVLNSVARTSSQLPAVRMVDGQQLPPSGLTVATADPMYVKGNYNTTTDGTHFSTALGDVTHTAGAALMADALTLQSSNWSDAYNINTLLANRNPASTTLNAATLEGIVPTTSSTYSGGLENFLRLLENWSSGTTVTYNGSIVVMFPSQYATSGWGVRTNIYNVPTRAWGFDTNFTSESGLPPLTPQATRIFRSSWAPQ